MTDTKTNSYERIYLSLWETAKRYGGFAQFRVIGSSHDERMIPMLEVGTGDLPLFCLSGLDGRDRLMPEILAEMASEYCQAYECRWRLGDVYDARQLLDRFRICVIPILNPDGWEIAERGFTAIRNPIYRQMLRMQSIPSDEFFCNARGMDLRKNFPTYGSRRKRAGQEPASENETKALMRIFQEYGGIGLLSFSRTGKRILCCRGSQSFACYQKSYRLARHLQKCASYQVERFHASGEEHGEGRSVGSPEQYYTEVIRQPALIVETPSSQGVKKGDGGWRKVYEEMSLLPMEFLFNSPVA
ncbi:MAG: M14 family zinc carboxypeptidase [Eubacteriales bacterium]|nr:M14 family zinc carboxypeptidase [Eubacteriales bacterium]